MTALELLKSWLAEIAEAQTYALQYGHWLSYDTSASKPYIALQVVGSRAPREVSTRWAHINVTLVGAKDAHVSTLETLAEAIIAKTELTPAQCGIVQVNALTDCLGPHTSEGKRPVLNITLELIF